MSNTLIGVYGASGFGREVMPLVERQFRGVYPDVRFVFVDDTPATEMLNGHSVLTYAEFLANTAETRKVVLAIANSVIREKLVARCSNDGVGILSVIADNVVMLDQVDVGEGGILCHFVQLTSNIRIGKQFHANISSYIAHDCVIGDYVTLAPGVRCNGNVHIEDHAYIGTGAILKQGTPDKPLVIGAGAVVGMGAVVTKSVPPGVTVIGNPAKPLVKK
ncbi:acetyltransferase [Alcanivorax sp. 97CO-5]|jgi:sugar O-acyltransferase (sialic acid O-acetyltransferase NeuD family)|uniref:NeuD/PglB/VioB family sugar acetyltransferase n=1 Tax=unclassified Alcanivorax TaxID=2638842 RepID=UPI0003E7D6F6|nr:MULTISPECIES: NeuD/PglB/VioB family sugar acetyltransferase [unclassified Alcanivorax]EUC71632.1 acetyltransferase [Alcanivorax sp. 97CO-5]PKG03136.1 acetyltransferase [Alcanivorax sp. 97CO-6]